ncbi:Lon protease family protein [Aestuariispira insulae]|uniref:endopeptidase La n=1 Tax=Aestuariispira insulae TaxID=1461337 RepID=A0A3D9HF03_9PROT|nr:ATP-binding protein [Aestuariispira insulae]RED48058.1 putative ATP-dependent protease [Aestuariispira insulae]
MPQKKSHKEVGLPRFDGWRARGNGLFVLSSHKRAREALEFGLSIKKPGFNIFVLGDDDSGRLTQTMAFLTEKLSTERPQNDWIYLNNFQRTHRPRPYSLPPGTGRLFRDRIHACVITMIEAFEAAFQSEDYEGRLATIGREVQSTIDEEMDILRQEASEHGLTILRTQEGMMVSPLNEEGEAMPLSDVPAEMREEMTERANEIAEELTAIHRRAAEQQTEAGIEVAALDQDIADSIISELLSPIIKDFGGYPGIGRWLTGLKEDIMDNLEIFQTTIATEDDDVREAYEEELKRRYGVNLLVDNGDMTPPEPVLEPSPTYENLMGYIEYRSVNGELTTDFSMIRPGALHRANGGVLVLRAQEIAEQPEAWAALKGALRDSKIRIEERHRQNGVRVAGSPSPKAVPLDVKVVLIGAPHWYYTFFSADPDFAPLFKVKADIDPDMAATTENLSHYAGLLRDMAKREKLGWLSRPVLMRMLGKAARLADDRSRLSSRYELLVDLMVEARHHAKGGKITINALEKSDAMRRRRNARIEDRMMEQVTRGSVLLDVEGQEIGQVNALTVYDTGDHSFGNVSRVTARASAGRTGLINIERQVDLGGPLQQKGAMILHGYLTGLFARVMPIAFNCTITFEQSYSGVEGDSATVAELLAVLSELAGCPLRQDLAITGSMNQRGVVQPVGGIREKVEAFYHTCLAKGPLTGKQGVVVPEANRTNLIFDRELELAVSDGSFHIWTISHVDQALSLFTDMPVGELKKGQYIPDSSIYGRVAAQLEEFDMILREREGRLSNMNSPR